MFKVRPAKTKLITIVVYDSKIKKRILGERRKKEKKKRRIKKGEAKKRRTQKKGSPRTPRGLMSASMPEAATACSTGWGAREFNTRRSARSFRSSCPDSVDHRKRCPQSPPDLRSGARGNGKIGANRVFVGIPKKGSRWGMGKLEGERYPQSNMEVPNNFWEDLVPWRKK